MLASILALAGFVWAKTLASKTTDFNRCPSTCSTLTKYYGQTRPTLRTHEGDKQCWQTCDVRFGQGKNMRNAAAAKKFWLTKKDTNLHANQCAQACWRAFHKGSDLISVAGLRSTPRSTACAGVQTHAIASAK
jgi:hypothetical protein